MDLFSVIVTLVVIFVVFGGLFWFADRIAPPAKTIVQTALALGGIILVLGVLLGKIPLINIGW
jgi:hypothetical protein